MSETITIFDRALQLLGPTLAQYEMITSDDHEWRRYTSKQLRLEISAKHCHSAFKNRLDKNDVTVKLSPCVSPAFRVITWHLRDAEKCEEQCSKIIAKIEEKHSLSIEQEQAERKAEQEKKQRHAMIRALVASEPNLTLHADVGGAYFSNVSGKIALINGELRMHELRISRHLTVDQVRRINAITEEQQ